MKIQIEDVIEILTNELNPCVDKNNETIKHDYENDIYEVIYTYDRYRICNDNILLENKPIIQYLKNTKQIESNVKIPVSTYMNILYIHKIEFKELELIIINELINSLPKRHIYNTKDVDKIYHLTKFIADCKFEIR